MTRWLARASPSGATLVSATDSGDQRLEGVGVVIVVHACMTAAMRSRPMPVSMLSRGKSGAASRQPAGHIAQDQIQISTNHSPSSSGEPGQAAPDVIAMIVESLGAGPAWTGIAHRPR